MTVYFLFQQSPAWVLAQIALVRAGRGQDCEGEIQEFLPANVSKCEKRGHAPGLISGTLVLVLLFPSPNSISQEF